MINLKNRLKKSIPIPVKTVIARVTNNIKNILNLSRYINNKFSKKNISEYRKTTKIYDIFTFFNELELLEIRLNILDKYVDYFVLVEATETFSGKPKKLYYEENKHLFKKFEHKIIHHITKIGRAHV